MKPRAGFPFGEACPFSCSEICPDRVKQREPGRNSLGENWCKKIPDIHGFHVDDRYLSIT